MAPSQQETHEQQNQNLLPTYIGISFTLFLTTIPKLQTKLNQTEHQLQLLLSRRKEDAKANAKVVEIFASHRNAWQQEEKRLFQLIDQSNEEIAYLKRKVEELEKGEVEMKAGIEDLRREVDLRDEMLGFLSKDGGFCYGGDDGFSGEGLVGFEDGEKLWGGKDCVFQDPQYEPLESVYHLKHFVARRESPWKIDGDLTGVSSKLNVLEKELVNLEIVVKPDLSKVPSQMRKQAKRYQALAGKIDELCARMQTSDPSEPSINPEFRTQRQTEFLLEAFRLQQRASETNQKLMALQTEAGKCCKGDELEGQAKLATKRSMDCIRNNFKEIQRNLEIWLARIIGDLEGILARDGGSRVREYYLSRYPFVQ